jgi:hypothetical protein
MNVRTYDGKLFIEAHREKLNMHLHETVSVEVSEILEGEGYNLLPPYSRAITIRSKDSANNCAALVIVLDSSTKDNLVIKGE